MRKSFESPFPRSILGSSPPPKPLSSIDTPLLMVVILLVCFGLIMVYSASFIYALERTADGFFFVRKQLVFASLGFLGLWLSSLVPYQKWARWSSGLMLGAFVLLVFTLIPGIGVKVGGARRWLSLVFFRFQPAELAKFAVIAFTAQQLARKSDRIHSFGGGIFTHFFLPFPLFVCLLCQPDFGSVMILVMILFTMVFLAGARLSHLLGSLMVSVLTIVILVISASYRRSRFVSFLDPWKDPMGKGFQIIQSLIGFHHGKFFGVGLGNGKEKLFYLPEAHNDFILSVVGEECGFIGFLAVMSLYLAFLFRGFAASLAAARVQQDIFCYYFGCGLTLLIGLQGLLNGAVVLGLLPTKGLPAPFVSYGGSAMLMDLVMIGVLLGLGKTKRSLHG